jgi:AcrR family transcriptional regulator
MESRQTPLSRALEGKSPRRITPLDVFELARTKWLQGERLDIGRLAAELGVGRATVFRWVGSKERLYGEICCALFNRELARAGAKAKGSGVARLVDTMQRLLRSLASAEPLRKFVSDDPGLAMRVLASRESPVQERCTRAVEALIRQMADEPVIPPHELAYLVVRITESLLSRHAITGVSADIEAAIQAIEILLTASPTKTKRR